MDEISELTRFDDRRVVSAIVARMRALGADLANLDVELSRRGPVDLDLLKDCLDEPHQSTFRGEPLAMMSPQAPASA